MHHTCTKSHIHPPMLTFLKEFMHLHHTVQVDYQKRTTVCVLIAIFSLICYLPHGEPVVHIPCGSQSNDFVTDTVGPVFL